MTGATGALKVLRRVQSSGWIIPPSFGESKLPGWGVADKRFILSVSTRLYADPGTVVTLTVRRTVVGSASVPSFPCSFSGYCVDAA
jgi:hypothetical protein